MKDLYYSAEEVENLTGKQRRPAQVRVLRHLGIAHKVRPDGTVAVLRAHAEKEFGLGAGGGDRISAKTEPDFRRMT